MLRVMKMSRRGRHVKKRARWDSESHDDDDDHHNQHHHG